MRLGDDIPVNVEAISTGSLSLDLALGIGGVPRGRIVEIYGPESCGKTTLALHVVVQRAEKRRRRGRLYRRGARPGAGLRPRPRRGYRQSADIPAGHRRAGARDNEQLVRSGALDVVVIDSVARCCPAASLRARWARAAWAWSPG